MNFFRQRNDEVSKSNNNVNTGGKVNCVGKITQTWDADGGDRVFIMDDTVPPMSVIVSVTLEGDVTPYTDYSPHPSFQFVCVGDEDVDDKDIELTNPFELNDAISIRIPCMNAKLSKLDQPFHIQLRQVGKMIPTQLKASITYYQF